MLKRVPTVQKLWSSKRFEKPRKVIFASIMAQGQLLRKLSRDHSAALRVLESRANTDEERGYVEHLKKHPEFAFDGILAHVLVSGGCEERVLGESLPLSKQSPDIEMARFAVVVGNAFEETLKSGSKWSSGPRAQFKDPLNPLSLLFSIEGNSEKRMGHLITQAMDKYAFIEELREGRISKMGLEILRAYYEMSIKSASIADGGTIMMEVEGLSPRGVSRRTVISVSEKKIERFLEQIAKRLSVGFNDLFGKDT